MAAPTRKAPAKTKPPPAPELVEEVCDIRSVVENPRNPRKHPDEQLIRIAASLQARGQYRPLLARRENRMLIAGHGVRMAALKLGWQTIKVAFWNVDQHTADDTMLGDNKHSDNSTADAGRVAELLREIPEAEWGGVGYSEAEAKAMMFGLAEDDLKVFKIETDAVTDKFWISVRGPLGEQAAVLQRIKLLLNENPRVVVELGITPEVRE